MGKLAKRIEEARREGEGLLHRPFPSLLGPGVFEDVDRVFGGLWRPWWPAFMRMPEAPELPAVDVFEEGDAVVVKAELPGLRKEEIEVDVAADAVTISGKKTKEEKVEKKDYYRYERAAGEFHRSVTLPVEVVPEKASATLKEGVLELRVPKKGGAEPKARRVAVA